MTMPRQACRQSSAALLLLLAASCSASCSQKQPASEANSPCELASSSSCGSSGDGCVAKFDLKSPEVITSCARMGSATTGGACAKDIDCAPGHFCTAGGNCLHWCRLGSSSDCPGSRACSAFPTGAEVTSNGTSYGNCGR